MTSFLDDFFVLNKNIPGLKLDWHPFYKVMKYYVLDEESFFIRGHNLIQNKTNETTNGDSPTIFFKLSLKLSHYFTNEEDTTKHLVKKFIPHISANGHNTPAYLSFLNVLCPPHKGQYKLYIDYLLLELPDTSNYQCNQMILSTILHAIQCNIEDDFTFLIPVVSRMISTEIYINKQSKYPNRDIISYKFSPIHLQQHSVQLLAQIVIDLFISPPTRKAIINILDSFFMSFKAACHPSVPVEKSSNISSFMDYLSFYLRKDLRKLRKKKENKLIFNMKNEFGPSQDDLHKLLSMMCEVRIMNIRKCSYLMPILIDTTLDPLTIDRYLETSFQCINLTDAYGVSASGWIILSALIMSIDKKEQIIENFESIFQFAASNLYRQELQMSISMYLTVCFLKIPFNREKTVKGFEYIDFPRLAYSLISNIMNILRSLPTVNGETAEFDQAFLSMIVLFIIAMFQNCDNEVLEEILPIFTSLATDEGIANSAYIVENIVANYCFFARKEQSEKIIKAFKRQLRLNTNHTMFEFLTTIYSTSLVSSQKTAESVKQATEYLMKYTKSEDEKVRKIAWNVITHTLGIFDRVVNVKVTLKEDKIKDDPLEIEPLECFDIEWGVNPDVSDLAFEIFNPIFDKLLNEKDPQEIKSILSDVGSNIKTLIEAIYKFSEGEHQKEINEVLLDPIHYVPDIYEKAFPIRKKFIKCANRIIKDFQENDVIISNIIYVCNSLFYPYINIYTPNNHEKIRFLSCIFMPFENDKSYYNSIFLFNEIADVYKQRKQLFIIPFTEDIKELLTRLFELISHKSQSIKNLSLDILKVVSLFYSPFTESFIGQMIDNANSIPINEFINFLELSPVLNYLLNNDKLLCQTMLNILNNFNLKDKENLISLKKFMTEVCISSFSFETPQSNNEEYIKLLEEIEKNHINKNQNNRTFNYILIHIIFMCLKRVYQVNDIILNLIIQNITYYDSDISNIAEICLAVVLKRRAKFTKEKIKVDQFPAISTIPDVLNNIKIKFNENDMYFPLTLRTVSSKDFFEQVENVSNLKTKSTNILSLANIIEINEDVDKIFKSFANVEIEWNINENNKIYDSEFLFDQSNGHYIYREAFHHRKYEFYEDKVLIKNIPNIFSSAMNSLTEKNLYTNINYHYIWEQYSLTVGPYCIPQLTKIANKYLREFYSMNAEITTKILYDMITGFLKNICYWEIKDRIEFIKSIVLPVVCFVSSNKNTSKIAEYTVTYPNVSINPYCFSPLIKALFELSPKGPNMPLNRRPLISIISKQPSVRPFHFFNSIDEIKMKYIDPFIEHMSEYNSSIVNEIIELIFSFFECCSFSNTNSPMYSAEIEGKKPILIDILENILEKNESNNNNDEHLKRNVIRSLTSIFICFDKSSYDVRLLLAPLLIKHLHSIFNLLNSSNINEEDQFINSVSTFINNSIFFIKPEIELQLVSSLVKEMMFSSLPMQLILLESLNQMLESNIFNIPMNDYHKYEDILFKYCRYEKRNKHGNEIRMKISKIIGIFEIRNCTLNENDNQAVTESKTDEEKKEDEVVKAASIILNSYLFDRPDDRVMKSFEKIDEFCTMNGRQNTNNDFLKKVSQVFINRHTGHVLNEVEELIFQYKNILTPSYIS